MQAVAFFSSLFIVAKRPQMKYEDCMLHLALGCLLSGLPMVAQVEYPPALQIPEAQTVKHDGGKDDLQAIGNRKIGKRGLGNWYSIEEDIAMGREYSKAIESNVKPVHDQRVTEYVNRLGQNLVGSSDAKVPFTIRVIDSEEINAFALPGGFLYVNSGLILAAQDEAELAGVMAHEIAHVAARHATRQRTRSQVLSLASIPLIFVGGGIGVVVHEAIEMAIPFSMIKFS